MSNLGICRLNNRVADRAAQGLSGAVPPVKREGLEPSLQPPQGRLMVAHGAPACERLQAGGGGGRLRRGCASLCASAA
jgi:hypothetical protein